MGRKHIGNEKSACDKCDQCESAKVRREARARAKVCGV